MAGFGTFASFFFQKLLKQHSENKKKSFIYVFMALKQSQSSQSSIS
jgi:hypothetical protein